MVAEGIERDFSGVDIEEAANIILRENDWLRTMFEYGVSAAKRCQVATHLGKGTLGWIKAGPIDIAVRMSDTLNRQPNIPYKVKARSYLQV